MGIRFGGRWTRYAAVAAVVATAAGGWAAYRRLGPVPVPEVPRPNLTDLAGREVQKDVSAAAQRVVADPQSATAWGEYGLVLRAYQQHAEADLCLRTAADLDPADGRWPYLLGAHLADTDPEAAVGWLERAARGKVPAAAQDTVQARLVEVLTAAGRPADAVAAAGPDPAAPRVRLAAARAALAAGEDQVAAELLGDLAEHPLAASAALMLRADLCRRQGRTSSAAYLADRAAAAPSGPWPDPLADPIKARDFSPTGRMEQAARLLQAGRPAEAERLLAPLTFASPADPRPHLGLSEAREAQGDRPGALTALAGAVKADPKSLAANYQIGLLHFKAGEELWAAGRQEPARTEFREAVTWLDKAMEVQPDFGKALLLKGTALHRFLGQPAEGVELLRRFVQQRPEVGEGHLLLGQALADGGRTEEAIAALRRAAELAPPGDRRAADLLAKLAPPSRR